MIEVENWFDYPSQSEEIEVFIAEQTEKVRKTHFPETGKVLVEVGEEDEA